MIDPESLLSALAEIRVGPFVSPSGKRWALVRCWITGRRSVVEWDGHRE